MSAAGRTVLLEEVFEALAEKDDVPLRAELIQVAAVAAKWVQIIDERAGVKCTCWEDVVRGACMTGAVDPVTGRPTPPADDAREGERHGGYLQLHELVKDAPEGVRRAVTNDRQRVLANGSFALHPTMLRHLLVRAYEQGITTGTTTNAEDLIDTRAGLALANAAWSEGASTMLRSVNEHDEGPWSAPVSPYSAPLLARIRDDKAARAVQP